ncbi:MAG: hypothetical protein KME12_08915 [Trichocoleus desertorum ATA4-8-CV12]|jgi:hypothetical protein|nr:hypothetical protein [Trichocoleus desertorum ATA4-8-CV12]
MAIAPQADQAQNQLNNQSYRLVRDPLPRINQPSQLSLAILQRLWWHTKGYSTVLGVMLLVGSSLVFLSLHWLTRQLLRIDLAESSVEDAGSAS